MQRQFALIFPPGRSAGDNNRGATIGAWRARCASRRGVASVLAMMFLVIFGSLAVAMAVVAQGNLRTADSSLKVSRAMSAAETGLTFAADRMMRESSRFVVTEGVIDYGFGEELWLGTIDPVDVDVLPPADYTPPGSPPPGLIQAIRDGHLAGDHNIIAEPGDESLPIIDDVNGILFVQPIAIADGDNAPYFRLRYELLGEDPPGANPMVRVTSEGVDGNISRVLQVDFRLDKKIEFAIISTNRVMIGKNVIVEGPLGSRYGIIPATGDPNPEELDTENGDPVIMRSDFYYLHADLDTKLDTLYTVVKNDDVDGDARLRPDHPNEGVNLPANPELIDYDGNEYVDDFDLFMAHFDADSDLRVCYDAVLAADAGLGGLTNEFDDGGDIIDFQMCRLIDETFPDRDGDGFEGAPSDRSLGYRDGVLDAQDLYAKVTGRLTFGVQRADWEGYHGDSYQTVVRGPVGPDIDEAPVTFGVNDETMLEITTAMFNDSQSWFEAQVPARVDPTPGDPPLDPLLLAGEAIEPGTFTPSSDPGAEWESVPFGSDGAYDHYKRPVYEDMTFENVRIPRGTNGLFKNCTFVGVTWIESIQTCSHKDWNYAGAVEPVDDGMGGVTYELRFPDLPPPPPDHIDIDGFEVRDTRDYSNNLRFEQCTFLGSIAGDKLDEYTHWRNKIQVTGATRFYLDPADVPAGAVDAAGVPLVDYLNAMTPAERLELSKSSLLLPGWSVDVGNFKNEQAPDPADTAVVNLSGVIIAGVLDVRGTAELDGTLMMTFRPVEGAGPLSYGGKPDAFNTTIGYFGPADGDDEGSDPVGGTFEGFGEIRLRYNPETLLPDGIPWPVRIDPVPFTYVEGGS